MDENTTLREGLPMEEFDAQRIKIEINNFLFMNLPGRTTLDEMECYALDILEVFINHNDVKKENQ